MLRAGKVIVIVSIFLSALNSFTLSGQAADNINDSALASVSRVITPVFKPIGVHEDNWQATVGLFTGAMAKEVVVGTLNTLYTAENIQKKSLTRRRSTSVMNCSARWKRLAEPERHLQPERTGEPD